MNYQHYFQPHEEYFWELKRYRDDFGEDVFVYEIASNGSTIAYSAYVVELLTALSEDSLPPFGSLLLAITATNFNAENALYSAKEILKAKEVKRAFPNVNLYNVDAAFVFLNKLTQLPELYKTEEKRALLFQTIFTKCHNRVSRENAQQVIRDFQNNEYSYYSDVKNNPFNESVFQKDIKALALLNSTFPTVNSIIKAMEGLPDTNEKSEELAPEIINQEVSSENQKDFVDELIENNKTFHIGSLIKRLWSGLKIPLHHNLPSNQPLGGISDITNKGDFDKLLISEFANDDLVFMSRIANNEALYIEREVPPEEDKFTRDILIDSTLKNWGNPKVIAFATALAIAKHPKSDINCQMFVMGNECKEVEFETIHQVIDSLSLLSGKLEASQGLTHYFETFKGDSEKETFLILSEESFRLAAFQKVLHENFDSIHYVLLTTVDGGISFFKIANKGKKLIQKIQLPLDELWRKRPKSQPTSLKFTTIDDAPLLLPLDRNYKDIFRLESEFYTHWAGNLYQFQGDNFEKGFKKIASGISFRNKSGMYQNSQGQKIIVAIDTYYREIYLYNLETKEETKKQLPEEFEISNRLVLCPAQNEMRMSSGYQEKIWKVQEHGNVVPVIGDGVSYYLPYDSKLGDFIYNYKKEKINKFDINKKIDSIYINVVPQNIEINSYILTRNIFTTYYDDDYKFHEIKPRANLIFKRRAAGVMGTVKVLIEKLSISLTEATQIVEGEFMPILTNADYSYAEDVKIAIEETGAVCYIETIFYQSTEGSTITIKDAILKFESHDKSIPKFYIPFIVDKPTAFATDEEFAGNEYFLPEDSNLKKITVEEFHEKYITPFIKKIMDDEVDS